MSETETLSIKCGENCSPKSVLASLLGQKGPV